MESKAPFQIAIYPLPGGEAAGRLCGILVRNGLQKMLFAQGAIENSSFIVAPASTRNQKKQMNLEDFHYPDFSDMVKMYSIAENRES